MPIKLATNSGVLGVSSAGDNSKTKPVLRNYSIPNHYAKSHYCLKAEEGPISMAIETELIKSHR